MARYSPDRADLWQAARLFGACALAFGGGMGVGLRERYWAVITAIVVTQPMLSETVTAGRARINGTLIGAAVGFAVLELADRGLPILPLFWIALAPLTLLIAMRPYLRLSAVTLVVVVLVPSTGTPFLRPFDRVAEILLGTVAAITVAAMIRPNLWRRDSAILKAKEEAEEG